ncbi:MAG TPA: thioredoxin-disulfide reductase [Pseudobdellovibrionaceae bacterium]|nr:thioredoxin-disulfide reductase [Pseudobdellovibrionaceae bacterium]
MMSDTVEKLIIIGSGPAGYTAAIYSSRALLQPLMFEGEESGGQLMITTEVENYPGFPEGVTGPELMEHFRKQAERFGTRMQRQNVSRVDLSARPFKVWVGDKLYQSKALIIATGASAKYLGLPSEKQFANKGVSACATCDGAFFRNMDVAVIGGGDTAMEEATFLTRFAKKVYIIHRRDSFRASKIMAEKALKNPKIEVLWNTVVDEIVGDKFVTGVKLTNTTTKAKSDLAVQGVFLAIGHQPNTKFLNGQLETDELGYLVTKGKSSYTSVEGVFACGDVQDHHYRQAITAAGSGCMSAIDAERWLESTGQG